jgi:DME family drug/metabolite transporter
MLLGGAGLLLLGLIREPRLLKPALTARAMPPALVMVTYQLCFFGAVRRTGVAVGTVVALGTAPVLAGLLAWIFLKERPITAWFLATGLALTGCIFLMVIGKDLQTDASGIALALGAGVSYATYVVTTKRFVARVTPLAATTVTFCAAALLMLPLLLLSDMRWLYTGRGLAVALHLGLMTTSIAYLMFSNGILTTPASTATTFSLAEPVTATLLATVVLGERLAPTSLTGLLLVMSGLVVLALAAAKARPNGD